MNYAIESENEILKKIIIENEIQISEVSSYRLLLASALNEIAKETTEKINRFFIELINRFTKHYLISYSEFIFQSSLFLPVVLLPLPLKTLRHSAAFFRRAGIVA